MFTPRGALAAATLLALALPFAHPVAASPADYVVSPVVVAGERAVELRAGVAKDRDGRSAWALSTAFEYGLTDGWATEVYAIWHRPVGERAGFDAWEWENRFQLTETGRYPVELGLLFEVERPKDRAEGYELTYGPLLQTEFGPLQANLNLLFTRHVRSDEPGPTEFGYQWQLRWRHDPALDWGLQGFGDTGAWQHWAPRSEQSHRLGPAMFGRVRPPFGSGLLWNAGLLFGIGGAAPRVTLRTQVELEF